MKTINFHGYIDSEVWFGDEVTPQMLHDQLYEGDTNEDATILIHSYGGSCDAAISMFEDIRSYPGNVTCQVQVAASAATVVAMAGDTVTMSPVGVFMIHRPSTFAYGNEDDMSAAIDMLRAYHNSIMNAYEPRCAKKGVTRDQIIDLMSKDNYMDAATALELGFVDAVDNIVPAATNASTGRVVDQELVKSKHEAWSARDQMRRMKDAIKDTADKAVFSLPSIVSEDIKAEIASLKQTVDDVLSAKKNTVPADQLYKRLNLLKK